MFLLSQLRLGLCRLWQWICLFCGFVWPSSVSDVGQNIFSHYLKNGSFVFWKRKDKITKLKIQRQNHGCISHRNEGYNYNCTFISLYYEPRILLGAAPRVFDRADNCTVYTPKPVPRPTACRALVAVRPGADDASKATVWGVSPSRRRGDDDRSRCEIPSAEPLAGRARRGYYGHGAAGRPDYCTAAPAGAGEERRGNISYSYLGRGCFALAGGLARRGFIPWQPLKANPAHRSGDGSGQRHPVVLCGCACLVRLLICPWIYRPKWTACRASRYRNACERIIALRSIHSMPCHASRGGRGRGRRAASIVFSTERARFLKRAAKGKLATLSHIT
jgi:hypothetical protein